MKYIITILISISFISCKNDNNPIRIKFLGPQENTIYSYTIYLDNIDKVDYCNTVNIIPIPEDSVFPNILFKDHFNCNIYNSDIYNYFDHQIAENKSSKELTFLYVSKINNLQNEIIEFRRWDQDQSKRISNEYIKVDEENDAVKYFHRLLNYIVNQPNIDSLTRESK